MSFEHGSGASFSIDDSGGTPRDISAFVTNVDGLGEEVASHDVTTLGKTAVVRFPGLKDLRFTVTGLFDPTCDGYLAGIVGKIGTYTYGPQGTTAGDVKYTGEALCRSYKLGNPVGDMIPWTAEFERSDTGTRTTF